MNNIVTEQGLRDLYYDPVTGYQGVSRLYQRSKELGLDVTRKSVEEWLKAQDTYTRHKPILRRHKFR